MGYALAIGGYRLRGNLVGRAWELVDYVFAPEDRVQKNRKPMLRGDFKASRDFELQPLGCVNDAEGVSSYPIAL